MSGSQQHSTVIGRNLRNLRHARGVSQKEFAQLLGVSFQQINKYERGLNRLPVDGLYLISYYYNIPYEEFFVGLEGHSVSGVANLTSPQPARMAARDAQNKLERIAKILAA